MSPREVHAVRVALDVSQTQLAALLGVHALTVSKWERGILSPSPYAQAFLHEFARAARRVRDVGRRAVGVLVVRGAPAAVYALLSSAETGRYPTVPPTIVVDANRGGTDEG